VFDLNFAANAWRRVELRINSTDWNTINGLFIGYTARVSTNGGATWTPWGGFSAVSPTFMRDGVTKIPPGGIWDWSPAYAAGGILSLVVDCPTAFSWGATVTLTDT
jgi:hypothetical protein